MIILIVFFNNELNENSVIQKIRITTTDVKGYIDELLVKIKELEQAKEDFIKKLQIFIKDRGKIINKNSLINYVLYDII